MASTTLVQSGSGVICSQASASTSVKQHLSKSSGPGNPLIVNKTLRLMAWKVSGRVWPQKEFRKGLQSLSQVLEDQAHHLITNRAGVNGLAGVMN